MKAGRIVQIVLSTSLLIAGTVFLATPYVRNARIQRHVTTIEQSLDMVRNSHESDSVSSDVVPEQEPNETQHEDVQDVISVGPDRTVYPDLYSEFESYNQALNVNGQHVSDAWGSSTNLDMLSKYGLDALGIVEIPDMKVKLPLYVNTSDENLAKGAAVMTGTSMPIGGPDTNCVIAAHRGWRGNAYFQFIDQMSEGSLVYVHTPWETLTYRAVSAVVVNPQDSDRVLIQKGKDMLTLVSCHPYVIGGGPERYLVFCERVMPSTEVPPESSDVPLSEISESTESTLSEETHGKPLGPVDKQDDILNLEVLVQRYLPPVTLLFCGILILIRVLQGRKH